MLKKEYWGNSTHNKTKNQHTQEQNASQLQVDKAFGKELSLDSEI